MSGHSKWSTIKHKKGAADKARGKLFSKLMGKKELKIIIIGLDNSGKTTILGTTLDELAGSVRVGIVEGDIATDLDAVKLQGRGAQIASVTDLPTFIDADTGFGETMSAARTVTVMGWDF